MIMAALDHPPKDFQQPAVQLTADLVALCERPEIDPGPPPWQIEYSDSEYDKLATDLLLRYGHEPVWVFAYGSLLWKPACAVIEARRGKALGWQRAFCLEMRRWRGSPQQPGLMLGLRRGGTCEGLAYRLPDDDRHAQLTKLLLREVDSLEDVSAIRTIEVQTETGMVHALTFWADPRENPFFVDYDISTEAKILACACGHIGSGAAYLYNTVTRLQELGIADQYLKRVTNRVYARGIKDW